MEETVIPPLTSQYINKLSSSFNSHFIYFIKCLYSVQCAVIYCFFLLATPFPAAAAGFFTNRKPKIVTPQ